MQARASRSTMACRGSERSSSTRWSSTSLSWPLPLQSSSKSLIHCGTCSSVTVSPTSYVSASICALCNSHFDHPPGPFALYFICTVVGFTPTGDHFPIIWNHATTILVSILACRLFVRYTGEKTDRLISCDSMNIRKLANLTVPGLVQLQSPRRCRRPEIISSSADHKRRRLEVLFLASGDQHSGGIPNSSFKNNPGPQPRAGP